MEYLPKFSQHALLAGSDARHKSSWQVVSPLTGISPQHQRHAPLRARRKATTARRWIVHVNREDIDVTNQAFGAGTPLLCQYLLGWTVGPGYPALLMALVFILCSWVKVLRVFLRKVDDDDKVNADVTEVGMMVVTIAVLSFFLFAMRVRKRTPKHVALTGDDWKAICLETFLANTVMCALDGAVVHLIRTGHLSLHAASVTTFAAPFACWCAVQHLVENRQSDYLRGHHLAMCVDTGGSVEPTETQIKVACWIVREVCSGSRDLRMLGLPDSELEKLAALVKSVEPEHNEAESISFYAPKVDLSERTELLKAFNRGYEDVHRHKVKNKIDAWIRSVDRSQQPLTSILEVAEADTLSSLRLPLKKIPFSDAGRAGVWRLCGAIAKACDDSSVASTGDVGTDEESYRWFALFAAALMVNRNPLAAILAMEVHNCCRNCPSPDSEAVACTKEAKRMLQKMRTGCEQVLRQAAANPADADEFYVEGRGLVLAMPPTQYCDSPRAITYSVAEVWQAESARESVMLGEKTFESLWRARKSGVVSSDAKDKLWRDNVQMSLSVSLCVAMKREFSDRQLTHGSAGIDDKLLAP